MIKIVRTTDIMDRRILIDEEKKRHKHSQWVIFYKQTPLIFYIQYINTIVVASIVLIFLCFYLAPSFSRFIVISKCRLVTLK